MGVAEDVAFIRDAGTGNAPKGLRYWAPSASVIAANATVNLANVTADLGKAELALEEANVRLSRPHWLMAPRSKNYLMNLRDGNGNKAFPELDRGELRGAPVLTTTSIPKNLGSGTNESEIYYVDADELILAEDQRIIIEASPVAAYYDGSAVQAAFSLDQTVVRVIAQHDFAPRHPEAVAVLSAVTWGVVLTCE